MIDVVEDTFSRILKFKESGIKVPFVYYFSLCLPRKLIWPKSDCSILREYLISTLTSCALTSKSLALSRESANSLPIPSSRVFFSSGNSICAKLFELSTENLRCIYVQAFNSKGLRNLSISTLTSV